MRQAKARRRQNHGPVKSGRINSDRGENPRLAVPIGENRYIWGRGYKKCTGIEFFLPCVHSREAPAVSTGTLLAEHPDMSVYHELRSPPMICVDVSYPLSGVRHVRVDFLLPGPTFTFTTMISQHPEFNTGSDLAIICGCMLPRRI